MTVNHPEPGTRQPDAGLSPHPVIRIVTFIVAAAFLARGTVRILLAGALVLCALYLFVAPHAWRQPGALVRRLRWLLLSLLVVYGWFTPGAELVPGWGVFAPSVQGLREGLARAAALLLMAGTAQLLMATTGREQLLAAIYWLARPLRVLGISRERLALRLALTLDAVPRLGTVFGSRLYDGLSGNALARLGQVAARAFQGALDQAGQQSCAAFDIATNGAPPLWQWLYPALLGLTLMLWGR